LKRLILLRHAKAQPADGSVEDFDRTLMLSGMQDAAAMARYLHKNDYAVDQILC
jgi:phosphohistidine phosphatase SixA